MKKRVLTTILLLAMVLGIGAPAAADDWIIRLRGINVAPDASSGAIASNGTDIAGSGVDVDDATVPELDITYMLNDNWGLELILAVPPHDISATGSLASLGQFAEVTLLPPALTLQYHFAPEARFRPYVGAGINFTLFFDEETTDAFNTAVGGVTDFDLDESFGFAAQIGVDIGPPDGWFFNLDLKYVDLSTTAEIQTGALGLLSVDVDIDPIIYGIGFGKRF